MFAVCLLLIDHPIIIFASSYCNHHVLNQSRSRANDFTQEYIEFENVSCMVYVSRAYGKSDWISAEQQSVEIHVPVHLDLVYSYVVAIIVDLLNLTISDTVWFSYTQSGKSQNTTMSWTGGNSSTISFYDYSFSEVDYHFNYLVNNNTFWGYFGATTNTTLNSWMIQFFANDTTGRTFSSDIYDLTVHFMTPDTVENNPIYLYFVLLSFSILAVPILILIRDRRKSGML